METGKELGDSRWAAVNAGVGAHGALSESWLKSGRIEVGEEFHSSIVDHLEVLIGNVSLSSVEPELDDVFARVARVVNGVAIVIGLEDVEIGLWDSSAEERDVESTVSATVSLSVDTDSWGPESEDLGLE